MSEDTTPNAAEGTPNTGAPNAAEGTPNTGAPNAAEGTPPAAVEYTFKAPEGVTYDEKIVATVTEFAKEHKLPAPAAQRLLDTQHGLLAAQSKALAETVEGWKTQLAADAKLGGDKLDANRAIVNKALGLDAEAAKFFEESGAVHNPAVFRYLHEVGKALSEDRFVAATGQPPVAARTIAKSLYPNNA